ncbi:MAG TPA: Wzz/FepE/Etk N-terminal domain-containing protein [Steroidobacteraceae bacterium]|nr:Wzz/FepE/Etk N-terminal domain-containing protein [Steroidobacteraceae bacterium]
MRHIDKERLPALTPSVSIPSSVTLPPPPLPPEEGGGGMSLHQVLTILRTYWKHSVVIAVVVTALGIALIKVLPKLYTSTATLMVSYEVNDPLVDNQFPIELLTSYISTQMQIMQSPEVMLGVVDKLNLTQVKEFASGYHGDPRDLRDWVKDELGKRVTVAQGDYGSQLVYIKASAQTPGMAAALANAVAEVYLQQHLQGSSEPASERATRAATELAQLKQRLGDAQQRVADYRQRTGVTDLTATAGDMDQTLLTQLEQRYQEAHSSLLAAEVHQSGDRSANDQVMGSQLVQNLRAQLDTQNAHMAELRATLGPRHPKVIQLQSQIDATQRAIAAAVNSYSANASVDLQQARDYEQKLQRAVEQQRARVLQRENVQAEGTKLLLELDSAQAAYKHALDASNQLTLSQDDHYTNVHLISSAQSPVRPDKPNKPKLALMALMAAIVLGLVLPFGYELFLNRRVRCRDDIERDLGIDVLAELQSTAAA